MLRVFGHEAEGACPDVAYVNWLLMVRAGLTALEFYTPATAAWRQAHMHARYVILRVLLEAGGGLVELRTSTADDGAADVTVLLDRAKVPTVGRAAIGKFLLALQTHKSLGDQPAGAAMFEAYSAVPPEMLALREVVMGRKEPRKLLVQPAMRRDGESGEVTLSNFDETFAGMVDSFVARFPPTDAELLALYRATKDDVTD